MKTMFIGVKNLVTAKLLLCIDGESYQVLFFLKFDLIIVNHAVFVTLALIYVYELILYWQSLLLFPL